MACQGIPVPSLVFKCPEETKELSVRNNSHRKASAHFQSLRWSAVDDAPEQRSPPKAGVYASYSIILLHTVNTLCTYCIRHVGAKHPWMRERWSILVIWILNRQMFWILWRSIRFLGAATGSPYIVLILHHSYGFMLQIQCWRYGNITILLFI